MSEDFNTVKSRIAEMSQITLELKDNFNIKETVQKAARKASNQSSAEIGSQVHTVIQTLLFEGVIPEAFKYLEQQARNPRLKKFARLKS